MYKENSADYEKIDVSSIRNRQARKIGSEYVALIMFNKIGLEELYLYCLSGLKEKREDLIRSFHQARFEANFTQFFLDKLELNS